MIEEQFSYNTKSSLVKNRMYVFLSYDYVTYFYNINFLLIFLLKILRDFYLNEIIFALSNVYCNSCTFVT